MREVVNAIFYLNRAGCPWRMLPRDFPPWRTVYNYFGFSTTLADGRPEFDPNGVRGYSPER